MSDELKPDDIIHLTVKQFEQNYVSRQSFDALRADIERWKADLEEARKEKRKVIGDLIDCGNERIDLRADLAAARSLMGMKDDALQSYSDFYDELLALFGLDGYPHGDKTDDTILEKITAARARIAELEAVIIEADAQYNTFKKPRDIESAELALVSMASLGREALDTVAYGGEP